MSARVLAKAFLVASIVACSSESGAERERFGATDDADAAPDPEMDNPTTTEPKEDAGPAPVRDAGTRETSPAASCEGTSTCGGASDLGSLAGDDDPQTISRQGRGSQWFRVRVNETYGGATAAQMKLTLSLVSPPGTNYDLFTRIDPDSDRVVCSGNAVYASARPAGTTDEIVMRWGEQYTANNSDDSRTVTIFVQHVTGPCGPDDKWTLLVQGNR
jgi:hypothetical protein